MKPSVLESILNEALANGYHASYCAFDIARRAGDYLPANHPNKPKEQPNINACNCWKKKATRMLRALGNVERTRD